MKKKILLPLLAVPFMIGALTGCNSNKTVIGILQPVGHPALDAAREGFIEALKEKGFEEGKNISIQYKNANQNSTNLVSYSEYLVDKSALTLGIGTDAALALKGSSETKGLNKPVLFTAVTDPKTAELVTNYDAPEGFVTGTSDAQPIAAQIDLVKEIIPSADKIGVLYTLSEINSQVQAADAKTAIEAASCTCITKTCTNTDIATAAASLFNESGLDAVYLPTDNNIAAHVSIIKELADAKHILVVTGEEGMLKGGGHITLSINYKELGKRTGYMAASILSKEKTISQVPVVTMTKEECEYVYCSANCTSAGITIPPETIAKCRDISK